MPAWAWAAVVWGISLPIAFLWARRQGFLAGSDPIVVLRVPIVAFLAPAIVLAALVSIGARGRRNPPQ
jgi:hypothetical protein